MSTWSSPDFLDAELRYRRERVARHVPPRRALGGGGPFARLARAASVAPRSSRRA